MANTSIKESDRYTWKENLSRLCYLLMIFAAGLFVRSTILPLVTPKPDDPFAKLSLFYIVDFFQVFFLTCPCVYLVLTCLNWDVYRDQIEILSVKQEECPACKQVRRMEYYKIMEGPKKEKFDNIEYEWDEWKERVHCTSCCHTYSCDVQDDVDVKTPLQVRHRKVKGDSLAEPLLSVEIV